MANLLITPAGTSSANNWTTVTKSADESRNTTTTFTDDATLLLSVAANTTYMIRGFIAYSSANATPDFKYRFNAPASPTYAVGWSKGVALNDDSTGITISSGNTANSVGESLTGADVGAGWVTFEIYFSNGANAGTFSFQWAQITSDANNVTVRKGSYIEYATTV